MSDNQKGALHLTDADFQKTLDEATTPVFVDFYAEWCGPCQMAAPIIDKLADEYKGKIMIAKLDVDANSQSAQEHQVMSIPTVIVFKKNEEGKMVVMAKKVGFPGEGDKEFKELVSFIKEMKFERLGVFKYSREEDTQNY